MWKVITSTFILVFLAELGDKTQLSTMVLASKSNTSIWYVFIGSAVALVLSSLLGVLAGTIVNKYIPSVYIQVCSGASFIVIGALLLWGKL